MTDSRQVMDTFSVIRLLWASRKIIIKNVSIVTLFSVALALLLPVWYSAGATLLPSTTFGGSSLLGSGSVSGAISALGLGGAGDELNMYISLLKSRKLRSKLIEDFGLLGPDGYEFSEDALNYLDEKIEIEISDEGALIYRIYDQDPEVAYAMANTILDELGKTTVMLGTSSARKSRRFVEHRITSIETDLLETEKEMHEFTKEYGIFNLPESIPAIISQLVGFELLLAQAEVAYSVANEFSSENNPATLQLKTERDKMELQFDNMIHGRSKVSVVPNMEQLPDMAVRYARLVRDLEIARVILEFLYPQFEQARLQEEKDEPTLHVLDYPEVPGKKSKPQRSLIVIGALIFSGLISCAWVVIDEQLGLMKESEVS